MVRIKSVERCGGENLWLLKKGKKWKKTGSFKCHLKLTEYVKSRDKRRSGISVSRIVYSAKIEDNLLLIDDYSAINEAFTKLFVILELALLLGACVDCPWIKVIGEWRSWMLTEKKRSQGIFWGMKKGGNCGSPKE